MKKSEIDLLLRTFNRISGMGIGLLGKEYHIVYENPNGFCLSVERYRPCLEACIRSDNEAFEYVRRTKQPYFYNCPHGIREILVPVLKGGEAEAFLIAELGVLAGDEEKAVAFARKTSGISDLFADAGTGVLTVYTPEQEKTVAEMMEVLAKKIEEENLFSEMADGFAASVKNYLVTHSDEPLRLDEISRRFHCSTVTLTQTFRHTYGVSVMNFVNGERMQKAKRMLTDSQKPVGTIAEFCGFTDAEYFGRCFKKAFGLSPREFRKQKERQKER